jgi:hypothetical protein
MIVTNFYNNILLSIVLLIVCHLLGDYVLQTDYIAKTKGDNLYHLIVHCVLYCLPFLVIFGLTWQLIPLLGFHYIVDILKARFKIIPYWLDQVIHYLTLVIYFI